MRRLCLAIIGFYQRWISPCLPPACRFEPTCSRYAWEAIHRHGMVIGIAKALARLLRCHPLHPGGYDPVK
jgi:putative membrane protein insertion efficiency factor